MSEIHPLMAQAADRLRETWPYLFDSSDLPAEEVAKVVLDVAAGR